jgi:hypothetical protein
VVQLVGCKSAVDMPCREHLCLEGLSESEMEREHEREQEKCRKYEEKVQSAKKKKQNKYENM